MDGWMETQHTFSRCWHFFRDSGLFNPIPFYHKAGMIFNLGVTDSLPTLGHVSAVRPRGRIGRTTAMPIL
jgi:hypothetical protein